MAATTASRLRGQRRLDVGDDGQQRDRRPLEVVAALAHVGDEARQVVERHADSARAPARRRPEGAAASARKTCAVASGTARIDEDGGQAGSAGDRASGSTFSPMPRISAGTPARQTGTSAPSRAATSCQSTASARSGLARRTARSSAAASADPPPSPAATGRFFSSSTVPSVRPGIELAQEVQRPLQQVRARRCRAANGPRRRHPAVGARRERHAVADVGEGHQALDLVVAVGATAEHASASG